METTTIRVSLETRDLALSLARANGLSIQDVIALSVELYRRQKLLADVNAAYAALRSDPAAWSLVEEERSDWDATLQDGLEEI